MSESENLSLTIEELSFRSGVTTRNIRAYQSRGLIPPPSSRPGERTGYYGLPHLGRLRLISRLQERGFSLAGIADLLEAWSSGRSLEQVMGMEAAVEETRPDDSVLVTEEALRAGLPADVDADDMIRQLRGMGLVVREGSHYRMRHPALLQMGVEAAASGIPLDALLAEFARVQKDAHRIARRFVKLYNTFIWMPYLEAGMPAAKLPEMIARMKRLRAMAVEITQPLMADALTDEIEAIAGQNLPMPDRAGKPKMGSE